MHEWLDGGTESDVLENFLTEEEAAVLAELDDGQCERYLAATASYEAMCAYLANPAEPENARSLLDLSGWK
jgi:hypothetical protein